MILWKKILRIDGVNIVWQKPNMRLFFNQKLQLTSVEDNTNAQFVAKHPGYKADDPQLKVFTRS